MKSIDQEQKSYERALKRCRTKEEVQRLKLSRIGSSLSTVRSVEHNSAISDDKKLKIILLENRRCTALNNSTLSFIRRGCYAKLPTDAEFFKALKEGRTYIKLHFVHPRPPAPSPDDIEQPQLPPVDPALPPPLPEETPQPSAPPEETTAPTAPGTGETPEKPSEKHETPHEREIHIKVRRAKAAAAYAHASFSAVGVPAPALDTQA